MERTIEIGGLSDELLNRLDERASQVGVERGSYVRHLIERAVASPSSTASFSELLEPVHNYTDAHGLSEQEIEQFFSEQLTDSRRERRRADESGRPTH
jgi:hypothetical protein